MIGIKRIKNCLLTITGLLFILTGHVWAEDGIPEGYILVEGDILIPVDAAYDGAYGATLWTNGVISYEFHDNVNATNQQRAIDAMEAWSETTTVTFIPHTTEANYVRFMDHDSRNYSALGMVGGRQTIAIHRWDRFGTIAHEIGHTLSLFHEQGRPDRVDYVTINTDRINEDGGNNFNLVPSAQVYGPYDFDSVMHYSQCSFSICDDCSVDPDNCRTITVNPLYATEWQDKIGQRTHLSYLDQVTIQMLYPETYWKFINGNYTGLPHYPETGSFTWPYNTFAEGIGAVLPGGTLIVQPDTYVLTGYTFSKHMLIRAPLGDVLIE